MRMCKGIFLWALLGLLLISGCSDGSERTVKTESNVSRAWTQQLSNTGNGFSERRKDEADRRMNTRSFKDSIANYFDRLTFLTEEEKARLLKEEKAWAPMVRRLEELNEEITRVIDKYYFGYGSILAEYNAARTRHAKIWHRYTESSELLSAVSYGDPDVMEEMLCSDILSEEEKEQLIEDEEVLKKLQPQVEQVEDAIRFEIREEEQEKWELIEKMVAVRAENREIWNRIHAECGMDLEAYVNDVPREDFESWARAQETSENRKRDRLSLEWREELPFLHHMRGAEESIEKYFPQLPFLTVEEKEALLLEEAEWKAEISNFDERVKENEEIREHYIEKYRDLFERVEAVEKTHGDLRRRMDDAFYEALRQKEGEEYEKELRKSEEDRVRESAVLSEEEKKLLLEDLVILQELKPKIKRVFDEADRIAPPYERLEEQLLRKIQTIHEKNRDIWEKIGERGLKLELSTKYVPPIASERWFQK